MKDAAISFVKHILIWTLVLSAGPLLAQAEVVPSIEGATAAVDSVDTELPATVDLEVDLEELTPDFWTTGISSTSTVLMTPLVPGWGQLYTDNNWKGALAFGLEMFYWSNMLVRDRRAVRAKDFSKTFEPGNANRDRYDAIAQEDWEQMRDFAWWSGGVLFIIALDAYVGAHLFNFDQDAAPVPNDWEGQFDPLGGDVPTQSDGPSIVVFQHGWRF